MAKGRDSTVLTFSGAIRLLLRGISIIAAILVLVCAAVNLVDIDIPVPTPNDELTGNERVDNFITRLSMETSRLAASENLEGFTQIEDVLARVAANHDKTKALSIWMVILASVTVLLEIPLIVAQFLSFDANTIFNVVDVIISLVLAVAFFSGAVPASVYTNVWSGIHSDADATVSVVVTPSHYVLNPIVSVFNLDRITTSTGALAAFGFVSMIVFILLALWVLFTQCCNIGKKGKKSGNNETQSSSDMEKKSDAI